MTKKKKQVDKVKFVSGIGMLSYPHIASPDTGRAESSNKYSVDLLLPADTFKEENTGLIKAVLQVGREYFEDDSLTLSDFKNPFYDMDEDEDCDPRLKGHIRIRAKSEFEPLVIGPKKNSKGQFDALDTEEIKNIKGGDFAKISGVVYPYSQKGGGVTISLDVVQFVQAGEPLGQGKKAFLDMMGEVEVDVDEVNDEEESDDDSEEEIVPKSKSGKKEKTSKLSGSKPKKVVDVESDEADDEEEEEEEEAEEKPKKKAKKDPFNFDE